MTHGGVKSVQSPHLGGDHLLVLIVIDYYFITDGENGLLGEE